MKDSDIIRQLKWSPCIVHHRYCTVHRSPAPDYEDICTVMRRDCAIVREGLSLTKPAEAFTALTHALRTYVLCDLDDEWTAAEVQRNVRSAVAEAESIWAP